MWAERRARKQRAELRAKARETILEATGKLAQAAWKEWRENGTPAGIEEALKAAAENSDVAAKALIAEGDAMRAVMKELTDRLSELRQL